jgi:hypothetical protein
MTGMRTNTDSDAGAEFLATSFVACSEFRAPADGSPVCDACGWLSAEHGDERAVVRALPGAVRLRSEPKRLAS